MPKPFVLPLQIFATITLKITFSQNSNETRRIWGHLAAPVVANSGKKHVVSLCSRREGDDDDEADF